MRKIYSVIALLLFFVPFASFGQVTISLQDFETTPALPTLTFANSSGAFSTGTNPAAGLPSNANLFVSGARGWQANNATSVLTFANQSLSGYTTNYIDFRLAGMSLNSGNGIDAGDLVTVAISLDNTTYSNELTIAGSAANRSWDFSATGSATVTYDGDNNPTAVTSPSGSLGVSTVTVNVPNSATQVRIRITLSTNDGNERYVIDDVRIRGTAATPPKYWDANGATTGVGFSGTWGTTFSTSATGNIATVAAGTTDDIIYDGTTGTVTLAADQTAASHTFNVSGYTISNTGTPRTLTGPISLVGTNTLTFAPATATTLVIPGIISGTTSGGGITQNGAGITTLSGINTFTGPKALTTGTLNINNAAALGTNAGTFTINGGVIDNTSGAGITTANFPQSWAGNFSFTGTNPLNLGTGAVSLTGNRTITTTANTLTEGGVISGAFGLTKAGTGTLTLTGVNTYSGATTITAGEVRINPSADNSLSGALTFNGGTLATTSITASRSVTYALLNIAGNATIALGANTHSLKFTSAGSFTSGSLTITGWLGTHGAGTAAATGGKVFVGASSTALTCAQLAQIQFFDGTTNYPAALLSTGELVPVSVPTITSISPTSATAGGGAFTLTVNGTNFTPLSVVNWGGAARTTTFVNSGQITASIPGTDIAANGSVEVGVTTGGCYTTTTTVTFTINIATGTITLSPASQPSGPFCNFAGNTVSLDYTITGTVTAPFIQLSNASGSFASGTTNLGGTVSGSGTLTITGTIPAAQTAGTLYRIRIVSTDGTPVISSNNNNNIIIYAQPTVAAITGGATSVCTGYTTLAFDNATAGGTWSILNGSPGAATINTTTRIVTGVTAGTVNVVYTVTNGTCTNSVSVPLTINATPPNPAGSITSSANPSCGPATLSYPAGSTPILNYWQTTLLATSTANPTSINYMLAATGTIYARTQNTSNGCWSLADINTGTITINTAVTIATQPVNTTVTSPAAATFTVAVNATGTSPAFQWQIYNGSAWVNLTNTAPYSGTTTGTLTVSPSSIGLNDNDYRCLVTSPSPCSDNLTSNVVTLSVNQGPCVMESFTNMPVSSASYASRSWTGDAGGTWVASNARTDRAMTGRAITVDGTSTLTSPTYPNGMGVLSFDYVRDFTGTGARTLQMWVNGTQVGADIVVSPTSDAVVTYSQPINISGNVILQIRSSGAQIKIDNIAWACYAACTPTQTITSFTPTQGPAGTIMTITGTGFTGATEVEIGGVAVSPYTVVNSTTITVKIPSTVVSGPVGVTVGGCRATTSGSYTMLTANNNCGVTAGTNGLIISEIFDSREGGLSYIEIFNPTSAGISLSNYSLRIATGANTDYSLGSSMLASGATFVVSIGDPTEVGTTVCGVTANLSYPAGSGFNGNDRVILRLSGANWDVVDNPDYGGANPDPTSDVRGFSQLRNAGNVTPRTTYFPGEWTNADPETCSHLGVAPAAVGTRNVTVTTQPVGVDCAALNLSVTATGNPAINTTSGYTWYYAAPGNAAWALVSTLNGTGGLTVTGSGSNAISITGNVASLKDYQFYVAMATSGSPSCERYSNAVQNTYATRPIYRSNVTTGNWSTPGTWQMSNDGTTFVATCTYPIALNSDQIIIATGHQVTLDIDVDVDKLTINTGATLTASLNSELSILNGGTGAEFIINGTYVDQTNSSNNLNFATGASWQMGATATLIKTNNGSATAYRDNYENGITNIPATANWILRYDGVGAPTFTTAAWTTGPGSFPSGTFYPNLTFESVSGAWAPASALNRFSGSLSTATIKGNLDIGGTGTGTVTVYNENTFSSPLLVNGSLNVRTGNTFTNNGTTISGTGVEVKGNVTIDGTFTNNFNIIGLLKLSGTTGTQNISGTGTINLQDMTFANAGSTATLNKSLNLPGVLKFDTNAGLDMTTGDITLKSTATATARVDTVKTAYANITYGTGRFNVERFYPGNRSWRLVTSPLSKNATTGTIYTEWQNNGVYTPGTGTFVTGTNPTGGAPGGNGLDDSYYDNYSMKTYGTNAYVDVANTLLATSTLSGTANAASNIGYFMFVRGDRRRTPDNTVIPNTNVTTLTSKGKLQIGQQTFSATNATIPTPSYTLVGNPYASPVDFNKITKNNVNPNRFYVWDPNLSQVGAYVVMENVGAGVFMPTAPFEGSSQRNAIQSSQAFFVERAAPGAASVVFEENHKSSSNNLVMFRPVTPLGGSPVRVISNLLIVEGNNTLLADGNFAELGGTYSNAIDINDALKFVNVNENLGFRRDGVNLAVERRGEIIAEDTLFYHTTKLTPKNYRLQVTLENMDPLLAAILEDNYTNTKTPMSYVGENLYDFVVNGEAASYAANRFRLVFKTAATGPLPVTFTNVRAYEKTGNNIAVEWTVQNELNISNYEVENSTDGISFVKVNTTIATGANRSSITYNWLDVNGVTGDNFYRIRSIENSGKAQYSSIVRVNLGKGKQGFSIYPNPVINGNINLQLTNMQAGIYHLRLVNNLGQVMLSKSISYISGAATYTITPNTTFVKGIYQLEVTHPDKTKQTLKVIN